MGYLSRRELASGLGLRFDSVDVDPALMYGPGYNMVNGSSWTPPLAPRVSRAEAMSVSAVKRCRDLICSFGTLPLELVDANNNTQPWAFFKQPEEDVAGPITWTNVAEDLLLEKVSWLRIKGYNWRGFPGVSRRLDPRTVTVQNEQVMYRSATGNGMAAEWIPDDLLIRFDSPNDALLRVGARAIRMLLRLEHAASGHTDGTPPIGFFVPADADDPGDEDDIKQMLSDWRTKRREGGDPYIPAAVKYQTAGWNPEQLQLVQAREFAITEIARLAGVDTEELGVSTTSRTYFNAFDRTQAFIQFTLMPYLTAIESRLSMDDVTPRGYRAKFNLDSLFRADTLSRYQAYAVGLETSAITKPEIRIAEGRPPLDAADQAEPAPAVDPAPADNNQEVPTNA